MPPILPPQDGFLFLDPSNFAASFAADLNPELAAFIADSQVPWGVSALEGAVSQPSWKCKPNWYLVATDDKMIPPGAQRAMSKRAGSKTVEVKGSHAVYVSQPEAVADLIAQVAQGGQQKLNFVTARAISAQAAAWGPSVSSVHFNLRRADVHRPGGNLFD